MLFRFIATIASAAFVAQSALAAPALTIQQVVTNIGTVTRVSGDAANTLISITPQSSSSDVSTAAQSLVGNFQTIVQSLAGDTTAMGATPPFSVCADTQAIIDALQDFVQFGVTAPITAVLRTLESGIDAFAKAMITMLPSCNTASVQQDQNQLDLSVGNTITNYEEFCIPSPLYPTIMPICPNL